jgi:toxin-antitoxin system PIN domain toxin
MTSFLIDVNVWLAMTWNQHPQHHPASRWQDSIDRGRLLFCRFTMMGFLRLLTNQAVMGDSTVSVSGALELYDVWRDDPRVDMAHEPFGTEAPFRHALARFGRLPATKAIADCYLIGFAEAAGAQIVTFDKGLARNSRIRNVPVTLLTPG